jgi:voltage-gated potassium channel
MNTSGIYNWCFRHRHPIFLAGLLSFFILPEILEKILFISLNFPGRIALLIMSSLLIIQTQSTKSRGISIAAMLAFLSFIIIWAFHEKIRHLEMTAFVLLFIYFSFISKFLFKDILKSNEVTSSVVFGAFTGYFIIGVLFFFIFALLDVIYPDTTSVDMDIPGSAEQIFYFSFVTLTTIGYGDILPTSVLGQKIVILEALFGQFYIAAIMATIVGKFLNAKSNK